MMDTKIALGMMSDEKAMSVRAQFPILSQKVNDKPLCYLDSAASAQKPNAVLDCLSNFYSRDYSNIHRGMHTLSMRATAAYEEVRGKIASFLGAQSESEIVFTSGTTAGINLVAQTWGRANINAGDEILVSEMEHHSNIVPWQLLAGEKGAKVVVIPMNDVGELDQSTYASLLNPKTKLVAVGHVSNALGTINPVKEMGRLAHDAGAVILVDGAQSAPHMHVDVVDLDCDFYAFSAHKTYGPTGTGALFGKKSLLDEMPPWQGGGDMIDRVSFEGTTYNEAPMKFEAGTPNIAAVIGMGAGIDWMMEVGIDTIAAHEAALLEYATERIQEIPGIRVIGTAKNKAGVLSFWTDDAHPQDIGTILDQHGVAVRAGHHCAQPVMDHFGIPATARASFAVYNTKEDVDQFITALKKTLELFA
ncbi:MAG: cysteine desulfurase/selenocysteine lyase [Planctomycetota bacterium]|jgi:cysteine desulfurase/selenocysteine lyase